MSVKANNMGIWLIYLRKSRQDDPNETVEPVSYTHLTLPTMAVV